MTSRPTRPRIESEIHSQIHDPIRPNAIEPEGVPETYLSSDPSDYYEFEPQKDITAYDLALILVRAGVTCHHEAMVALPISTRKHFRARSRNASGGMARRRPG